MTVQADCRSQHAAMRLYANAGAAAMTASTSQLAPTAREGMAWAWRAPIAPWSRDAQPIPSLAVGAPFRKAAR